MKDLYGIVALFRTPNEVTYAAARLRRSGYRAFDTYTPFVVEGLDRFLDPRPNTLLPVLMFVGAIVGAGLAYWIQYWDEAVSYPLNVGGRPYNSWPAFAVGTFEFMLLAAMTAGFFGMLAVSRLPLLYHPIFESKAFERASCDRFVICVKKTDPRFDAVAIRALFEQLGAESIEDVLA